MSAQAKSVAMIALDWERMNWDQVGPVRSRVGLNPAERRIFQIVDAAWCGRVGGVLRGFCGTPSGVLVGQPDDQGSNLRVWVPETLSCLFMRRFVFVDEAVAAGGFDDS